MSICATDSDLWDAASPTRTERGVYVAISGNTAAGKSTMIQRVVQRAQALGHPTIGVSERTFHHPYLTRMFSDPGQYAFPIQLHFMLQRHLVLLRQFELGRSVVMERSHFDDELFMREHEEAGHVSAEQAIAYRELADVLHAKLRAPDILVLMNPAPEISLARLLDAEERGERPREFPSEDAKEAWVKRWYAMYQILHQQYATRCAEDTAFSHTQLIRLDATANGESNANILLTALLDRFNTKHT